MTTIRIKLTADHFRTLVTGGEVNFDEKDIVRSKGIELKPTTDDGVSIILEDMGWPNMAAIIEEVWHGDAESQAIKARDWKILHDDSLWNLGDQSPERKP